MRLRSFLFLILALAGAARAATAADATWRIGDGSEVAFTSKASLETFDGRTQVVHGEVTCDPGDLSGPLTLRVEVDLASLDTGIGLRNTHMRERHLQTDRYPQAVFTGRAVASATPAALEPGQAARVAVTGELALHGVTRPLTVEAEVTLGGDGGLRIVAAFPVRLSDHDIPRPQFLALKLADEQQVRVELVAARVAP